MPRQRDCLIWKAKIFFPLWLFGVLGSHFLHGQVENWPSTSQEVQENVGNEDTQPSHKIYLGIGFPEYDGSDSTTSNQKIRTVYDYNDWFIHPDKGYLGNQGSDSGGFYIHYHPYLHAEGEDQFHWLAKNVEGIDKNFSLKIEITPQVDDLEIYISDEEDGEDINNPFRKYSIDDFDFSDETFSFKCTGDAKIKYNENKITIFANSENFSFLVSGFGEDQSEDIKWRDRSYSIDGSDIN